MTSNNNNDEKNIEKESQNLLLFYSNVFFWVFAEVYFTYKVFAFFRLLVFRLKACCLLTKFFDARVHMFWQFIFYWQFFLSFEIHFSQKKQNKKSKWKSKKRSARLNLHCLLISATSSCSEELKKRPTNMTFLICIKNKQNKQKNVITKKIALIFFFWWLKM